MDAEEKRSLAEKVVDLTVMNRVRGIATDSNGPNAGMTEEFRSRMRAEQTALYVKHYEPEQFIAILDFYNTDIGKSILASQERLADEMASGTRLVSEAPGKLFQGGNTSKS